MFYGRKLLLAVLQYIAITNQQYQLYSEREINKLVVRA